MKTILAAFCCIALSAMPALAQKHAGKAMAAHGAMSDQQFVDFAGQTDMIEANLGDLAQQNAASQDVKDYGQMLRTDHTNDYQKLKDAAQQANLNVPTGIEPSKDKELIEPLRKLHGEAFDHKFISEMISGHTQAIAIYKKESDDAQNPAIKSYANEALPVLQKHLDKAKDLEKNKTK